MKVVAVLSVRNRAQTTLRLLDSLGALHVPKGIALAIVVVDDGSTDDTSRRIRESHPDTVLLEGDGTLYWGGAIHIGTLEAMRRGADAVWWLNDDVEVEPNCLTGLLEGLAASGNGIALATVYDADGNPVYGGYRLRPFFRFRLVDPRKEEQNLIDVDAMNGNCALISRKVLDALPLPDPKVYVHNGGDMEFALRAGKHGYRVVVVRGASCLGIPNLTKYSWQGRGWRFVDRWRAATSKKGMYPPMRWDMCKRHGGPLGTVYFFLPYLKLLAISVWYLLRDAFVNDVASRGGRANRRPAGP